MIVIYINDLSNDLTTNVACLYKNENRIVPELDMF